MEESGGGERGEKRAGERGEEQAVERDGERGERRAVACLVCVVNVNIFHMRLCVRVCVPVCMCVPVYTCVAVCVFVVLVSFDEARTKNRCRYSDNIGLRSEV